MIRCVRKFSKVDEVREAHDAAGGDEQADEEGQHDAELAALVFHLQAEQLGYGQEEDDEVEGDVQAGVDVRGDLEVAASAGGLAVPLRPEVGDGRAFEEVVDCEGGAVDEQGGDDGEAGVLEGGGDFGGEDAEVEEDDGDLGEDHDPLVDVLFDVEELRGRVRWGARWLGGGGVGRTFSMKVIPSNCTLQMSWPMPCLITGNQHQHVSSSQGRRGLTELHKDRRGNQQDKGHKNGPVIPPYPSALHGPPRCKAAHDANPPNDQKSIANPFHQRPRIPYRCIAGPFLPCLRRQRLFDCTTGQDAVPAAGNVSLVHTQTGEVSRGA